MDQSQILHILQEHRDELRRMGVKTLALFGSAARGELRPESDIDLLVELEPPYTFDRYIRVKFYLEDLLHHPVDLVMAETLKARIKPYVESEAVYVP